MTSAAAQGLASQLPVGAAPVAIEHATVVDVVSSTTHKETTVVITDGRIAAVGPTGSVEVPAGARSVDASGRFVIPGLWDMHVHQFDPDYLPLFLVNGVTGIRHMSGIPAHHRWREQLAAGELSGPRMIVASPIVDGPRPLRPGSIPVADESEARDAVRRSGEIGADFVKIYNLIPRTAFQALAEEAERLAIPFAGHLPLSVSLSEAAAAGQASVEHLEGLLLAASTASDTLQEQIRRLEVRSLADMSAVQELTHRAAATFDHDRAESTYGMLVANGTWLTPTLTVLEATAFAGTVDFPLTDYLPYIEPNLRAMWEAMCSVEPDETQRSRAHRLFERQLSIVGDVHRAGIGVLCGTDTFVPGYSLHDELALLVQAGLSPIDAIRTATAHPAEFIGVEDDFGTIEPGKVADLVLLMADPLDDVRNTREVDSVVLAGTLLDGAGLSEIAATTTKRLLAKT